MNASRYDEVRPLFSVAASRRSVVLHALGAGLSTSSFAALAAGGPLTTFGRPSLHAQVATPVVDGDWSAVQVLIRRAEDTGGTVGVGVHGIEGELFSHNGDRRFRAASTIKVPIMIEAYRQIEQGAFSLDDQYRLRDEDRVPGSGVLGHLHAGLDLTVADLLYLMIAVSDNTATNLIIDRVGLDAVNATMQSLGMSNSVLGRRILGHLPKEGDPENWATPRDFSRVIQTIVTGEAAGPESCTRMLETLEQQGEIRRISRFLPAAPDISWGTKPGDLPRVINDIGFVTSERGTLCIAVYCENLPDLDVAERTIGEIARASLSLTGIISFDLD